LVPVLLSRPDALMQFDFSLRFHLHLGSHPRITGRLPERQRCILVLLMQHLGSQPFLRGDLPLTLFACTTQVA
jgi:hypothetical protein